jgi:transposase-like protein
MANGDEVERLRRELSRCPGTGRGRRYPEALRRRAGRLADVEQREARSIEVLARRLGVSAPALTRWMGDLQDQAGGVSPLRSVEIVPDAVGTPSSIVVRGPQGIVIEGLELEQVAQLVRSLA